MVQLTGDAVDVVAYKILLGIAKNENKTVTSDDEIVTDKAWILGTLREIYGAMNAAVRN